MNPVTTVTDDGFAITAGYVVNSTGSGGIPITGRRYPVAGLMPRAMVRAMMPRVTTCALTLLIDRSTAAVGV
ncbi:hypothetical protein ACFTUC_12210 [Streptomyces sp. NPDC056944]|uniref:hypothetical protein n=1 Tax=Streptomyces sp. NPDC056944 TaxID=3345972 RepID=UPI00362B338D